MFSNTVVLNVWYWRRKSYHSEVLLEFGRPRDVLVYNKVLWIHTGCLGRKLARSLTAPHTPYARGAHQQHHHVLAVLFCFKRCYDQAGAPGVLSEAALHIFSRIASLHPYVNWVWSVGIWVYSPCLSSVFNVRHIHFDVKNF